MGEVAKKIRARKILPTTSCAMALLRAAGLKRRYEPKPRYYHYSGAIGGQCVVLAGRTANFTRTKEELSSTVEVFDQYSEAWTPLRTTGSPPKGLYEVGCCVSPSGQLYVYGGIDGSRYCGGLYMFSSLREWKQLSSESDAGSPSLKSSCGVAFFDEKKIAVIGGYGKPPDTLQPGALFKRDERYTSGNGRFNEIHVFDTEECK